VCIPTCPASWEADIGRLLSDANQEKSKKLYLNNRLKVKGLGNSSDDRIFFRQEAGTEFNPQYHKRQDSYYDNI
jgi:hypothetical protein